MRNAILCLCCLFLVPSLSGAEESRTIALDGGMTGQTRLTAVAGRGVVARSDMTRVPGEGKPAAKLTASSKEPGRHYAWLELPVRPTAAAAETNALVCRIQATGTGGIGSVVCVLAQDDGERFLSTNPAPLTGAEWPAVRFNFGAFRRTTGEGTRRGKPDPVRVNSLRIGFLWDGPGSGELAVRDIAFTSASSKPTRPFFIGQGTGGRSVWVATGAQHARWVLKAEDGAGPEGRPATVLSFTFPGGQHSWAWADTRLGTADTSGYTGVSLTYKTEMPAGFRNVNVLLRERTGGAYWVTAGVPPSPGQYATVVIPLDRFQPASWTKDENGRFDVELLDQVSIGFDGRQSGSGKLYLAEVKLVP